MTMSLKAFHVVFISASVLLAFFFGAWCLHDLQPGAGRGRLAAGVLSLASGAALAAYEVWFLKKMRGLP
jgi:hypothetical protein